MLVIIASNTSNHTTLRIYTKHLSSRLHTRPSGRQDVELLKQLTKIYSGCISNHAPCVGKCQGQKFTMPLIPYYLWGVTSPPQNTEKRCPKDISDCLLGNQKYWLKFVVFFPFFRHVLIIFSLRGVWLVLIVDAWIIHYNYQVKFMRAIDLNLLWIITIHV